MSDSRAVDGAQPSALSFAAPGPLLAAGPQDGKVVALDTARLARSARTLSCPPTERVISALPLPSPTLASAEAAGILQTPPDINTLIRRLRA
ncbi:hypothetical protein AB0O64_23855 [Streptomyces sp. NPDC088341]|uniref:hypothetical protein n=1 Tax=Streptomyces sp. NPDC088341 TaxID=3154870 RepID=UPI00343EB484